MMKDLKRSATKCLALSAALGLVAAPVAGAASKTVGPCVQQKPRVNPVAGGFALPPSTNTFEQAATCVNANTASQATVINSAATTPREIGDPVRSLVTGPT